MKKILLGLLLSSGLLSSALSYGQSFTFAHDTVTSAVGGFTSIHNNITNTSSSGLTLSWRVIACDFPTDWLLPSVIGVCDACTCISNTSNQLWNPSTSMGNTYTCAGYAASATNDFHLQLDLTAATSGGTHFMTVQVTETGNPPKYMTFMINRVPVGIPTVTNNEMVVYPNPAHDELNVVFSGDVKSLAVYNIIGKVMATYRVTGSSANISLENVPSGIYFLRLLNSQDNVVATKKFTKQ